MSLQLEKFQQLSHQLIEVVKNFPADKIQEKLFDQWTIKEMIDHLSGWNLHTIGVLRNLKNNKLSDWGEETNEFNHQSVAARKGQAWKDSLIEFINSTNQLVNEYKSLSGDQFEKRIYKEESHRHHTPKYFLKTDHDHYSEHLYSIKSAINIK